MVRREASFRPLTGLSLYLQHPDICIIGLFCVSVPSRGYLYIYRFAEYTNEIVMYSFRPLTGLSLYLLIVKKLLNFRMMLFPSPHGVISISTVIGRYLTSPDSMFPSPHGVISISTMFLLSMMITLLKVSVPSRGYLYIYQMAKSDRLTIYPFPSPHGVISISTHYTGYRRS